MVKALSINLRQLERNPIHLKGELPAADLDLDGVDELIKAVKPLEFDLDVQKLDHNILAQGDLRIILNCECSRCLKPFDYPLDFKGWACHLPLEGEDQVSIVNDCVDLTPPIREDILLGFPQHPLCDPECRGLQKKTGGKKKKITGTGQTKDNSSAWAELNKLKF